MSRLDVTALATDVVLLVKSALEPLQTKLAVLEAKQAAPLVPDPMLAMLLARVAVLEARPLPVGEKGEKGDRGEDGKNGTPGLTYQGVYQEHKAYGKGDVVTWAGQMYHCHKDGTTAKPEEFGPDWQLCVKRGRDGKAAK